MRGRINNLARFGPIIFLAGLVLGPGAGCGREAGAPPETGPEAAGPVAVAGPDQIVPVGREVILDGQGSSRAVESRPLSFRWSLLDRPYFSGAFLLDWDREVTYFVPELPGRYYLELSVSDGRADGTDLAVITARIPRPGNRAPELVQILPAAEMVSVSPGQEVNFSVTAEDPDGDEMVFNWYVDGAFAASGPDFVFAPGPELVGQALEVRVLVSDGDKTAIHDWVVVISQAGGGDNRTPAFEPLPDQAVSEGETLIFLVRASDPDGDPVVYIASLLPAGAAFFKETGKFKWTPYFDQEGEYRVIFSASDGKAVSSVTVRIRVLNTNRPPTLKVEGSPVAFEGGEMALALVGWDPDEDPLVFDFAPALRGAVLYPHGTTATWVWRPDYDQAGGYRVIFTVIDVSDPPLAASVSQDLVVFNTNRPPALSGLADRMISEGQVLDFWLTAADPDVNNVTYAAGPMPRGSTLNVNTGEFFWVPDYDQAGDYPLTVTATDDGDPRLSTPGIIMLTVLNVNRPPAITAFGATPGSLKTGETVSFSVTAHDPDGDETITGYDWDFDGNGTWDRNTAAGSTTYAYLLNGNYTARVRAVDDGGLTAEWTKLVTVKPGVPELLPSQVMKSGTAMGIYLEVITPPAGYLYIADGQAGMEIFYVPNLDSPDPILISRTGVLGDSRNIYIYNKRAYLALSTNSGAEVMDVNDPSTPSDLGSIFSNNSITDIYIKNHPFDQKDYLFFSKESSLYGLYIYDLENQSNPIVKVQNEDQIIRDFWAADVDEKMNVFTASQYGMEIFNFQIPPGNTSHFFDKEIKISDVAYDVEAKHHSNGNDYVYLLAENSKLIIYSYSPIAPNSTITEKSRLATYSCIPERVAVTSAPDPDLAYITVGSCGYQIANLTDPEHPFMVIPSERFDPCTALGCGEHFYQMVNYGDFSFIGGGSWGLVVTENHLLGNPPATANPELITSYNTSGYPTDLQVKGNKLFLTLGRGGLDVYDLSSASDPPGLIGNVDTPGDARGLFSDGVQWAYLADRDTADGVPPGSDRDGLRIIDFATDPVRPAVKSSWPNPADPYSALSGVSRVSVNGNYAYLCADKLYIIDVTNKTSPGPVKAGDYSMTSSYPRDVTVSGDYAYVINKTTLEVLDINIKATPVSRGTYAIVNGQSIALAGDRLYVADGDLGLKIFNVSNPLSIPDPVTYTGKAYDVDLLGDYAFVADEVSGMVMLDVSNPASPILQVSQPITSPKVVNRISVYYDAGSHYYYVYTLNGTWNLGTLTLDQLSVIRIR